jgi:hypothetical protein
MVALSTCRKAFIRGPSTPMRAKATSMPKANEIANALLGAIDL